MRSGVRARSSPRSTRRNRCCRGLSRMTKEIGFIGLGRMGAPMAGRLLDAGYAVHVFDRRDEAIDAAVGKGGVAATSPADMASKVETVLVSLPTPDIVKQVMLGDRGVAEGT